MKKTGNTKEASSDKLKIGSLLGYGLGDTGMLVGWTFLSSFITYFMTNYVGIAAGVVGTVILASRLMDAISDVVIGSAVDRTKSRFGKARPWMLYGALPLTICFALLYAVPDIGNTGKLLWFIIFYNLTVTVFYTAVNVPFNSLTPLMTRDPSSRVNCGVVRMLMGIFAAMAVSLLTMPMINAMGGDKGAWRIWAIIIGVFMGVCILLCFLSTKERYGDDPQAIKKEPLSLSKSYKSLLGNKYWVILTIALISTYALQGVLQGVNIYYFKYIIGDENLVGLVSMAQSLPMLIMLFLTPLFAKKISKVNLARFSCVGGVLTAIIMLINPASLGIVIVKSVLQGAFMAPFAAVNYAMIADVADYGYWKSGVKCEGLVNSAASFGTKVGTGLGAGMVGWFLTFGGFNAELPSQPDSAIFALKFMMIGIPIIFSLIQFVALHFYKLDKEYPAILAELEQREANK